MTQSALNRLIACATGETVTCIRRLGFTLVAPKATPHGRRPRCRRGQGVAGTAGGAHGRSAAAAIA